MPLKTVRTALLLSSFLTPALAAAQTAPAPVQLAVADEEPELTVYGCGQIRQVAEVGAADIAQLTPGSSAFKAIEKLPGVNFQSADAFGVYEWSTRISLRGFNQNQLGFTLDGVPLGDMSYGNTNGPHISRAIISDNIGKVQVSQGAGALGTASTSNLGGTIEFFSRTPSDSFGLTANGTYGSNHTFRGFARIDTGDLGNFKGYLSYAYLNAGKWKGSGNQRAHQVNAKGVYDFGGATLTGFVDFSDRKEQDYQDLSLDQIKRIGFGLDNIASNWPLALRIAQVAANRGESRRCRRVRSAPPEHRRSRLSRALYDGRRRLLRRGRAAARLSDGAEARRRDRIEPDRQHPGALSQQQGAGVVVHAICRVAERQRHLVPHDRIQHQPVRRDRQSCL